MKSRLPEFIVETAAAATFTFISLPQRERDLMVAQGLQTSAKIARRLAETCLRYAIRSENRAGKLVSP
jgi:hypothetical protein